MTVTVMINVIEKSPAEPLMASSAIVLTMSEEVSKIIKSYVLADLIFRLKKTMYHFCVSRTGV